MCYKRKDLHVFGNPGVLFDMKLAKSYIKRINTCRKRDKMFNHKKILMVRGTWMPLTCPLMMLFSIMHDKPAISG